MDNQRTIQQNKALHLFYTKLADELNDAGLDQRKVLKPSIEIPWTLESVKNQLWRPIQEAMLSKKSTTELESKDIDRIYEVLMRHLGQSFGITVMFPSEEELLNKETK